MPGKNRFYLKPEIEKAKIATQVNAMSEVYIPFLKVHVLFKYFTQ